jgi:hypothetical protein
MNDQPWYLWDGTVAVPGQSRNPDNSDIRATERWEQRHDWRTAKRGHDKIAAPGNANVEAKALGEFRFALSGATATLASGGFSNSAGGILRNLDAAGDMTGLGLSAVRYVTFPLGDTNGFQEDSGCGYPEIANQPSGPNAPHVAEGIDAEARNEFRCLTSTAGGGKDVIDENAAIIHGVGLTPAEVATMAERGTSLIWSPRSNVSLYGDTAPVTLMRRLGVNIALGTDWLPSGSMNMSRELACVIGLNDNNYGGAFSREEIWRMVTVNAARATHADAALGSLEVGRRADIAVFVRQDAGPFSSVVEASSEDVALVLKGGRPLNGNASVVAALDATCDVLDVCGVSKRLCASRETGSALAGLQAAANGQNYALFNCGGDTPPEEPTCTPIRSEAVDVIGGSDLYTGVPGADDRDGDGVLDGDDNCPSIFNPARPVDAGQQGNSDGDAVGDVCDPCPLDADTTTCSVFNPNDFDGDGVDVPGDNCPDDANADQADADDDDKGDVCDDCPNDANPGNAGCAVDIVDVKTDPAITTGQRVRVENMVVTAVGSNGFWSQLDPATPGYTTVNHTCIFSFVGAATKPALGDKITIDGAASLFFGQAQLGSLTFSVQASGVAIQPTLIEDANITDAVAAGARAPIEGCLITLGNAVVADPAPPAGAADAGDPRNEFAVQGAVRVDDFLFLIDPQPNLDQRFAFITGPIAFRNGLMKLLPRSATDVAVGPVALAAVEGGFVRDDSTSTGIGGTTVRVRLSRAADADTTVTLTSGDETIFTVPASVVVPAGASFADVNVTGLSPGTTTLAGSFDGATFDSDVTVLAVDAISRVVDVEPSTVSLLLGQSATVTVFFDLPTPANAPDVGLVSNTPAVATVPASAAVSDDVRSVTFDISAVAVGSAEVTVTFGADVVTVDVAVAEAPSEVDLSGFKIVRSDNAASFTLPPNTVVPIGGYVVVARSAAKASFETFWQTTLGANVTYVLPTSGDFIVVNATDRGWSLQTAGNVVVDGPSIPATAAAGAIQRNSPVGAANQAASWTTVGADEANPGAGQPNSPPATSGCYISEVSDALGNGNFVNEFVEIHCSGALE